MKRISMCTPYVLTTADVENVIASLTPKVENAIASLLDLTLDEWRKLPKAKRVRHIVDYQNRAQLAASMAASAKAHTDLEAAAFAVTEQAEAESDTLTQRVARLESMLTRTSRKGA